MFYFIVLYQLITLTIFVDALILNFQVILQSETIQELTKTSEALGSLQQEASELRKVVNVLKTENVLLFLLHIQFSPFMFALF